MPTALETMPTSRRSPIDQRPGPEHDAVGSGPGAEPVGCDVELPSALVDQVVMGLAQRRQSVEVGRAAL